MTKKALYSFLFFLLPLVYYFSLPIEEGDLSVWVAVGKYTLNTNELMRFDPYSVLPTSDFIYPVLTTLIYALIDNLGGLLAVSIFHKFILAAILFVWYRHLVPNNEWKIDRIIVYLISILGASFIFIDRPALIGLLWFVVLLTILNKDKITLRSSIVVIFLNIFWVNTHGSWPILFAVFGYRIIFQLFFYKKNIKFDLLLVLLLLISTLMNPFGYKVFSYVLDTAIISKERLIDEWMPVNFSGRYASQVFSFTLLSIFSVYFAVKKNLKDSISSCFWPLMISGFIVIRNTVWPHFAFPILVSKYLSSDDSSSESPQKNALNLVIVIFLFVSMILFFPQVKPTVAHILPETKKYVFSRYSPKKISDYLNENTSSEAIFNQWELGSFLIYAQKRKIFIDTRNIIYKRENFNQYSSIINGGDYDKVFTKFKIGFIVFDKDRYKKFYEKLLKDNIYREVLNERGIVLFEINKRA